MIINVSISSESLIRLPSLVLCHQKKYIRRYPAWTLYGAVAHQRSIVSLLCKHQQPSVSYPVSCAQPAFHYSGDSSAARRSSPLWTGCLLAASLPTVEVSKKYEAAEQRWVSICDDPNSKSFYTSKMVHAGVLDSESSHQRMNHAPLSVLPSSFADSKESARIDEASASNKTPSPTSRKLSQNGTP
ncbi:hypothetical protein BU24DRAFT_248058 [Aaosphaeria arxii CBS 175.79]|uniref:Uncharacterized protein n=1 Tax=Aaosphaeria arxii CBS 175.79 TaxID=1450172 RepID=A0A6A5XKL2_9PLEO|nr:uncharacterized protein BU24DRAFT_248058 [Aaosphaeria arxii CBS 175.79]KAF2013818.1 hypothetical protein BU24DRAFT_248058 [Aaosphaeria arxii CBS 175.79]